MAIYQATVTANDKTTNRPPQTYVGLTENSFKTITRNVGQDGGYDKKIRNKMASDNARISIGI